FVGVAFSAWGLRRLDLAQPQWLMNRAHVVSALGCAAWCVLAIGIVPAERLVSVPLVFEQLHDALTLDPFGFDGLQAGKGEGHEFRVALSDQLNDEFSGFRETLLKPPKADERDVLANSTRPNVIFVVVE